MHLKTISFAILSALTLAACGGGGSDSDFTNGHSNNDKEWYARDVSGSSHSRYLTDKVKYSIDNNTLYADLIRASNGSTDALNANLLSSYVAYDGLYLHSRTKTQLGYKVGNLTTFTGSQWRYTPYNDKGLTGLKLTENFRTIDLSGKKISEYLSAFDHLAGSNSKLQALVGTFPYDYVNKLKGKNFPSGSSCLVSITSETNNDYMRLYADSPLLKFNAPEYFPEGYTVKVLNNYSTYVSKDQPSYYETDAVVKVGSDYYDGGYGFKGKVFSLDDQTKDYLKDYEDAVKKYGPNSPEATVERYYVESLLKQCTLFNKTASQAIDSAES